MLKWIKIGKFSGKDSLEKHGLGVVQPVPVNIFQQKICQSKTAVYLCLRLAALLSVFCGRFLRFFAFLAFRFSKPQATNFQTENAFHFTNR